MDKKKCRRIVFTLALVAAFLTVAAGIKTAHAGNLGDAALYAALASRHQGNSEILGGRALIYNSSSYLYDAYYYMYQAQYNAYYAYLYAGRSGATGAFEARTYASNAYKAFYTARAHAYTAYRNSNLYYTELSVNWGGYGAYYIAIAEYFAAFYCYGGNY